MIGFLAAVFVTALVIKLTSSGSDQLTADEYHELIRDDVPVLTEATDEDLDELADSICAYFRDDGTWLGWVKVATDNGFTGEEAGKITPYAVYYACPDQAEKLPSVD